MNDKEKQKTKEQNAIIETPKEEPYHIKELLTEGTTHEIVTYGNVAIAISIELLKKLVYVQTDDRIPNNAELLMFANLIIEHKLNPYLKECWLVMISGHYEPIVAAQARLRKAQSMRDYDGYRWGWIDKDGTRHEAGTKCTVKNISDMIGAWGEVKRKGISQPFYHEIFNTEYSQAHHQKPITMIMKVIRDQTHKFAYADQMGNLCTENEMDLIREPSEHETPKVLPRVDRKEAEDAVVKDSKDIIADKLEVFIVKLLDYILLVNEAVLHPTDDREQIFNIVCAFAKGVIDDEADYTNFDSYTIAKIDLMEKALGVDNIPEEAQKLFPGGLNVEETRRDVEELGKISDKANALFDNKNKKKKQKVKK